MLAGKRKTPREQQEQRAVPKHIQAHDAATLSQEFDVLVIGAGATGAGVALDAVTRGLKVACVERDDFAAGACVPWFLAPSFPFTCAMFCCCGCRGGSGPGTS